MKSLLTLKKFHKVDLGVGFLNDKSCHEIIIFLSNSTIRENVVKPLNEKKKKKRKYFSLLCDGSSPATANDEKKLYLIKTCKNGKPWFDVFFATTTRR